MVSSTGSYTISTDEKSEEKITGDSLFFHVEHDLNIAEELVIRRI